VAVLTALEEALRWHSGVAMLRGERWAIAALRSARRRGLEVELLARDWPDTDRSRAMALLRVDDLAREEEIRVELARIAWMQVAKHWCLLRAMPLWQRYQTLA
jgi:hypothetical protein